jgi:hypothetical protein
MQPAGCGLKAPALYGVFQEDYATAHAAHTSLKSLREVYVDRVISRGRWPPRSPDLTCDFVREEV